MRKITEIRAKIVICALLAGCVGAEAADTPPVTISYQLPADIAGGAAGASLKDAARFAWQEFIALNWPAVVQNGQPMTRDQPDVTRKFSDPNYQGPLVWHTYRGKVEIFPGTGVPNGGVGEIVNVRAGETVNRVEILKKISDAAGYGYDALPVYTYANGAILPATGVALPATPPWINLDENSEIGLNHMFAGVAKSNPSPIGAQVLFLAKANRAEFDYIAPKGWWVNSAVPFKKTRDYIKTNKADPTAGSTDLVSFPNGTVELKAAWRKLGAGEDPSRYYTTRARYYIQESNSIRYIDETLALVGLHIIQKTPSAPYFIFATFEQADNITDRAGNATEDENGRVRTEGNTTTPPIYSVNATAAAPQSFNVGLGDVDGPSQQLFYRNEPNSGLYTGSVLVNARRHPIASDVIDVNQEAHAAIDAYFKTNFPDAASVSPWRYYKLVSVQTKPIPGKTAGVTYSGPDASTYYQANIMIETDYNLQVFSGRFFPVQVPPNQQSLLSNTITDFFNGAPFLNVASNGTLTNMGGCMGCHGNAQFGGADFSFLLFGGRVTEPDTAGHFSRAQIERFKHNFSGQ